MNLRRALLIGVTGWLIGLVLIVSAVAVAASSGGTVVNSNDPGIYIVAILGFCATMSSPIVSARYIARSNKKASESAAKIAKESADAAAAAAEKVVEVTKQSAADTVAATKEVASTLAESTSLTVEKLDGIKGDTKATHTIVNSQRTELLRKLADIAALFAEDRPDDENAKKVAATTEADAVASEAAQAAVANAPEIEAIAKDKT